MISYPYIMLNILDDYHFIEDGITLIDDIVKFLFKRRNVSFISHYYSSIQLSSAKARLLLVHSLLYYIFFQHYYSPLQDSFF